MNNKLTTYISTLTLTVALLLGTIVVAGAQDLSVAVVDAQEIFMIHPAFQEAQQQLQEKQMEMMEELEGLDEDEAAQRQQAMQQELQQLREQLVEDAVNEVETEVAEMAHELGFPVVLNPRGIISGEEELGAENITEEIRDKMEERHDIEQQQQQQF